MPWRTDNKFEGVTRRTDNASFLSVSRSPNDIQVEPDYLELGK
jgi:hypothetical protein